MTDGPAAEDGGDGDGSDDGDELRFPEADPNVLEPGCARCPDLVESRTRISWGNGPADADLVVVGEAPGAGDPDADRWRGGNHTGLAYTSRHSGRRVRRLVSDLGYAGRAYYTNAVKCYPSDGEGGNREPTPAERERCRGHLLVELDAVDPAAVLATGKHATATLLAVEGRTVDGFLDLVAEPQDCPELGVTVVPVLHPSYREVWLSRLDYAPAEYRSAIAAALPEI